MDGAQRKARILELGHRGTAPYEIARLLTLETGTKVSPALVYYFLEKAGLWKRKPSRAGQRRPSAGVGGDPYRDRVDGILAKVDGTVVDELKGLDTALNEAISYDVTDLAPPPQPRGEPTNGNGFPSLGPPGRTLDQIEAEGPRDEDIEWLRHLRAHPDGTVTDRLRATESLLKWKRTTSDDTRKRLDDDQLVTLLGDILISLPEPLRQRVLVAATAAYSPQTHPQTDAPDTVLDSAPATPSPV